MSHGGEVGGRRRWEGGGGERGEERENERDEVYAMNHGAAPHKSSFTLLQHISDDRCPPVVDHPSSTTRRTPPSSSPPRYRLPLRVAPTLRVSPFARVHLQRPNELKTMERVLKGPVHPAADKNREGGLFAQPKSLLSVRGKQVGGTEEVRQRFVPVHKIRVPEEPGGRQGGEPSTIRKNGIDRRASQQRRDQVGEQETEPWEAFFGDRNLCRWDGSE